MAKQRRGDLRGPVLELLAHQSCEQQVQVVAARLGRGNRGRLLRLVVDQEMTEQIQFMLLLLLQQHALEQPSCDCTDCPGVICERASAVVR